MALGQEELKRLQAELASLSSSLSVEELKKEVERHKKEVRILRAASFDGVQGAAAPRLVVQDTYPRVHTPSPRPSPAPCDVARRSRKCRPS